MRIARLPDQEPGTMDLEPDVTLNMIIVASRAWGSARPSASGGSIGTDGSGVGEPGKKADLSVFMSACGAQRRGRIAHTGSPDPLASSKPAP
jgi:hypothetical protein